MKAFTGGLGVVGWQGKTDLWLFGVGSPWAGGALLGTRCGREGSRFTIDAVLSQEKICGGERRPGVGEG